MVKKNYVLQRSVLLISLLSVSALFGSETNVECKGASALNFLESIKVHHQVKKQKDIVEKINSKEFSPALIADIAKAMGYGKFDGHILNFLINGIKEYNECSGIVSRVRNDAFKVCFLREKEKNDKEKKDGENSGSLVEKLNKALSDAKKTGSLEWIEKEGFFLERELSLHRSISNHLYANCSGVEKHKCINYASKPSFEKLENFLKKNPIYCLVDFSGLVSNQ